MSCKMIYNYRSNNCNLVGLLYLGDMAVDDAGSRSCNKINMFT